MALYVGGDAAILSAAPDSGREKERACLFPMGSFAIGGSGPARYLTHIFPAVMIDSHKALTPAVPRHHLMYVLSPPWPLHPAIASALRILRPQFDGLPVCRVNLEMAQLRCLGALMQPPPQSGLMMERGSRFVES